LTRRALLGCFLLHFTLLTVVCCRDSFWVLAHGYTYLPGALEKWWQLAETGASAALGQRLEGRNPFRLILTTYLHAAGIERGYGFFAPNVPNSYKLIFEMHYEDGRIEYELPRVPDEGGGLRLVNVLNRIGRTELNPLREEMLKTLSYSMWQEHPDARNIRAVFGTIIEPTAAEAAQGKKEAYRFLYACDFTFTPESSDSTHP
jgi:hypothetical protein